MENRLENRFRRDWKTGDTSACDVNSCSTHQITQTNTES